MATAAAARAQLARDGFHIFRDVLDDAILDSLREASDASLAEQDEEHFADQVATGSMIMVDGAFIDRYPVFAELITYPTLLKALASLGFRDPKFGHGRRTARLCSGTKMAASGAIRSVTRPPSFRLS